MRATRAVALLLVAAACASTTPVPIRGGEVCFHCRRTIDDTRLATEIISTSNHAFKFSSVACLADYLGDHPGEVYRAVFVTDYDRGKLFPAQKAWFVKFEAVPRSQQLDYAAFRSKAHAEAFAAGHGHAPLVAWTDVINDASLGHTTH